MGLPSKDLSHWDIETMKHLWILRLVVLMSACLGGAAQGALPEEKLTVDYQRDNLSLNGKWLRLIGHDGKEVWRPQVQMELAGWEEITVPGALTPRLARGAGKEANKAAREADSAAKCVWVRRVFDLDESQANRDVVLKWNGIRFGATAWVNGREVTSHPTVGPHTALMPRGIVKRGRNEILLKVIGWGGLPKSKTGFPLVPTGGGPTHWGARNTSVFDDIYLEFYDRAYLKWILAMPETEAQQVTFRVWIDGAEALPKKLEIRASVRPLDDPSVLAGEAVLTAANFAGPLDVPVVVKNPKLWTPQTPHLYLAHVEASAEGNVCDKVKFRFGMRKIEVVNGHYRLNGKPLWLRGSNLVNEWNWGGVFSKQPKRYLVDEARVMNVNSFRTHTLPPPTSWVNIADQHGIMILAEMPVLFNYMQEHKIESGDWDTWHKNILIDAHGWITKLWNHPSIVMWVLSNETVDNKWEAGPYRDAVLALDPTRPTMRTGAEGDPPGTKENLDLHPCANIAKGPEGWLIEAIIEAAAKKDPTRTLTCTEYMNRFGPRQREVMLWTGKADDADFPRIRAEAAAEHTEVMRRVQLDGILPYMFAGWTGMRGAKWRPPFPTRMAAALYSSMAPVLASLDLFDRNFVAGQEISTPLYLINELHNDVEVTIDAYLTPKNPLLIAETEALKAAVWHRDFKRTFKADTVTVEQLRWKVPQEPGIYYLAAVLTRKDTREVVSQRMIRAIEQVDAATAVRGKRIIALGANEAVAKWMKSNGADYTTTLPKAEIRADVVIVHDAETLGADELARAPAILQYVRSGGKLLILNQPKWTWTELADFEIDRWRNWLNGVSSRVFPYEPVQHPILRGVEAECLKRWNGLPGTISDGWIKGKILEQGRKLLWQEIPDRCVVLSLSMGRGEILISLLHLTERINRDSERYDPTAERVFVNFLESLPRPHRQ